MAKITITICDDEKDKNKIMVEADPTWRHLLNKHTSGHELSRAEETAIFAMNKIIERSRGEQKKIIQDRLSNVRDIFKR